MKRMVISNSRQSQILHKFSISKDGEKMFPNRYFAVMKIHLSLTAPSSDMDGTTIIIIQLLWLRISEELAINA